MNSNNAEVKSVKVGETLTRPISWVVDGNPEPSLRNKKGVESRQRVCIYCGNDIPITRYQNSTYCSVACRNRKNSYKWAVKTGKIKNPGVGSGGNQSEENNPMYKNGIGYFQRKAFAHYDKKCNRCDSTKNLLVHHCDKDRTNNEITNLEILCKKCHQKHHCHRNPITGKYTKGYSSP